MRLRLIGIVGVALVAGCATHPNSIAATYVSPARFADLDCETLIREHKRADFMVREKTYRQEYQANRDALMVGASLLIWPALLAVGSSGNDAAALSQTMGERDALAAAKRQKNCEEPPPPAE